MGRFRSVGHRILFVVGLVLVIGFSAVTALYIDRQEKSILEQNEVDLLRVTQSSVNGLQSIMLKGYGGIAHSFSDSLKQVPDVLDYRVLRSNGIEAFTDNQTVEEVNAKLGEYEFKERRFREPALQVIAADDPGLRAVVSSGRAATSYGVDRSGERTVTILDPIIGGASCQGCHENGDAVRGVIKLTTSLAKIDQDIRNTLRNSVIFIAVCTLLMILAIHWVAHRAVVARIQSVTEAMSVAANGNLSVTLPVIREDEIGRMAMSFNDMSQKLLALYSGLQDEENKLTTIIQGAHEGIVVTNAEQQVVLVNPAATALLGKPAERIIARGFRYLLDDPEWMDSQLAAESGEDVSVIHYNRFMLAVQASTIRDVKGQVIGSAALIRDVTKEKQAEAELRRMAETDALTGLYNRRFFDENLKAEFNRWKRYKGSFSVALFDVDHFKKFNDTHGHECGDRVLQAISGLLRGAADPVALVCRYGGEELVLILPDFAEEAAATIADMLREMISDIVVDGLHVTASVGVAGCPDNTVDNPEALLKLADQALYVAKESGRNRVCRATGAPVTSIA